MFVDHQYNGHQMLNDYSIMKSTREHPNMLMQQGQNANPVMISAADIQATVKWQIAIIPHSIIHLMTTTAGFPE